MAFKHKIVASNRFHKEKAIVSSRNTIFTSARSNLKVSLVVRELVWLGWQDGEMAVPPSSGRIAKRVNQ